MAKTSAAAKTSATPSARRVSARPAPVVVPEPEEVQEEEQPAGYSEEDQEDAERETRLQLLREDALQHEVEYTDDTTEEELTEMVEQAKAREREAHEAQQAEAARMKAVVPAGAPPRSKAATGRTGGKKAASALDELRTRIRLPNSQPIEANKLPEPALEDYQLADLHGYPVAIPGAKAYRISISIVCPFGGGERPAGSVMLIHDIFSANKREYLTPV